MMRIVVRASLAFLILASVCESAGAVQADLVHTDGGWDEDSKAARDYVWGPEHVDELIAQVADDNDSGTDPETYFYLQDANYNVVAVMDDDGDVLTQYTYTPYGDLIHVDDLSGTVAAPVNRFLHQGLPLERFYAKAGDDLTTDAFDTAPILLVIDPDTGESPLGLYCNRNRWYRPVLGRFTSMDPNATALPIVTALAFSGDVAFSLIAGSAYSPR